MPVDVSPRRRRGRPTPGVARAGRLVACLLAVCAVLLVVPSSADAHPLSTTAVLLEIESDQVTGQVQLPIDRLAIAVDQPTLTTAVASQPAKIEEFRRYVAAHTAATDPSTGEPWQVTVTGGTIETIDNVDHLVYDVALRPPTGKVGDFQLHYDGIVHRLVSHRIIVSTRATGSSDYTAVGVIDWESQTLTVPARAPDVAQGFVAAVRLGIHHISEGADHLLFLIMLLLPAPLLARRGRWVRSDNLRRNSLRVVHVVTAFAIGHSITLALGAFGLVSVPTRVVESLIALSILVSAVNAVRPIVRGREVWIAAGFGLMHGLAFAALLGQLDLTRRSLVTELLGFNVGIEITQLMVVALIMPSLMVLSRTRAHPPLRLTLAGCGIVLAAAWLAERTTLITTNPLEPVSAALVAHPLLIAGALALGAAASWCLPRARTRLSTPTPEKETTTAGV